MIFMVGFRPDPDANWELCGDHGYFLSADSCSSLVNTLNDEVRNGNDARQASYKKLCEVYKRESEALANMNFLFNLDAPQRPQIERVQYTTIIVEMNEEE